MLTPIDILTTIKVKNFRFSQFRSHNFNNAPVLFAHLHTDSHKSNKIYLFQCVSPKTEMMSTAQSTQTLVHFYKKRVVYKSIIEYINRRKNKRLGN